MCMSHLLWHWETEPSELWAQGKSKTAADMINASKAKMRKKSPAHSLQTTTLFSLFSSFDDIMCFYDSPAILQVQWPLSTFFLGDGE